MLVRGGPPEPRIRPLDEGDDGERGSLRVNFGAWDDLRQAGVGRGRALRKSLEVLGIHIMHKES